MLGILQQFRILTIKSPPINSTQVRWRVRKPMWMGTAKSKLYRIPKRPVIPDEERDELQRLFNNYRTVRKSINKFLEEKYSIQLIEKSDSELLHKAFEEDFIKCNAINDEWNKKLAQVREERISKEIELQVEKALKRKEKVDAIQLQQLLEAEERVRQEKEAAVHFITLETLDDVIEKAIENPVDYSFAIDLEGNRYEGRNANPGNTKIKELDN